MILNLFAGPGGWCTGARMAGASGFMVGLEHDMSACRTAVAADHHRIQADVAAYPPPTHQPYRSGRAPETTPDLFGDPLPVPVSMAEALGWGLDDRPAWTVTAGGTDTGGAEVFGNAKCREQLRQVVAQARNSGPGAERDPRPVDAPSYTIRANGSGSHPSGTEWVLRNGNQANACARARARALDEPAGTLFFGQRTNAVDWVQTRPATTVCGDPRIGAPGHRDREGGEPQFGEQSVRVSVQEAGVLQSFPVNYPWQGTKSAQFRQCGDAVPPLLAAAILRPLIGASTLEVAA